MRPVTQTILTVPDGDCFAACVASLLGLPLEEVPNYHGDDWWERWQGWFGERGVAPVFLHVEPGWSWPGYWIGNPRSPLGARHEDRDLVQHAVVMRGRELAHDPHPRLDFLPACDPSTIDEAIVLAPLDPEGLHSSPDLRLYGVSLETAREIRRDLAEARRLGLDRRATTPLLLALAAAVRDELGPERLLEIVREHPSSLLGAQRR